MVRFVRPALVIVFLVAVGVEAQTGAIMRPQPAGPVLNGWAFGHGDGSITLKPTIPGDGMVAAADLYALDRPPALPPGGPPPAFDIILGRLDTVVISADGCILVDGTWQPYIDHAKVLISGVPETAMITGMRQTANGPVPILGPGDLANIAGKELLVQNAPAATGQLQVGYDAGGKTAVYGVPNGQNGCTRRAVVWLTVFHDVNTARAEIRSNWNAIHAGNQAFDIFSRGSDFNQFDVNPVFFGQLPAAGGDPAQLKSQPKLLAEKQCGGFPLDSTLDFTRTTGFLQQPDGYQPIFGLVQAYQPPIKTTIPPPVGSHEPPREEIFPTTFAIPLTFFDPKKLQAQAWSSSFALNDGFRYALLQMLIRDIAWNAGDGFLSGVRYADSNAQITQMLKDRITTDIENDIQFGRFDAVTAALGTGALSKSKSLPVDDPKNPSLDDWKKIARPSPDFAVSKLLIDLTYINALTCDPAFRKASLGRKLGQVLPYLDSYFPLLEQRWQFDRFHSTDVTRPGTADRYGAYRDAVTCYNDALAAYLGANPDCDGRIAGTHQVLTGPHAGRFVTCPQPPAEPALLPMSDSVERFPAADCRVAPVTFDQSELCSLGHLFFAAGSGASGRMNGFAGHVNFGQATYFGRLQYENHSPPRVSVDFPDGYDDDDVDWNLETPLGEGSSGGFAHLHVEHSGWSTLRQFPAARTALMGFCENASGNACDCGDSSCHAVIPPADFWQVLLGTRSNFTSVRRLSGLRMSLPSSNHAFGGSLGRASRLDTESPMTLRFTEAMTAPGWGMKNVTSRGTFA